ncbi:MAG: hypothetical protein HY751_10655 [Nitrospinae bacterium]|nr:hypothetical protein [Nitrospinota bacterium]
MAKEDWLNNVLFESFLVHFRNMYDFFYPPGSAREDDILEGDWFDNPEQPWSPAPIDLLEKCKEKVHKKLAHLTYARLEDATNWEFARVAGEIKKLMAYFLEKAPEGNMDEGMLALKKQFRDSSSQPGVETNVSGGVAFSSRFSDEEIKKYIRPL